MNASDSTTGFTAIRTRENTRKITVMFEKFTFWASHAVVGDSEAVGSKVSMVIPTHYTVYNDMSINMTTNEFLMTNNSALLHRVVSGVMFDCFSSEGFWIFHGARDTSSHKIFGSEFSATKNCHAFPTKTV
jgi:hypothetical protein